MMFLSKLVESFCAELVTDEKGYAFVDCGSEFRVVVTPEHCVLVTHLKGLQVFTHCDDSVLNFIQSCYNRRVLSQYMG